MDHMDHTDVTMAINEHDEYRTHQQQVADLVIMLRNSGQDEGLRKALADGDTVPGLADALAPIWDVDAETLAEAIAVIQPEVE